MEDVGDVDGPVFDEIALVGKGRRQADCRSVSGGPLRNQAAASLQEAVLRHLASEQHPPVSRTAHLSPPRPYLGILNLREITGDVMWLITRKESERGTRSSQHRRAGGPGPGPKQVAAPSGQTGKRCLALLRRARSCRRPCLTQETADEAPRLLGRGPRHQRQHNYGDAV